MISLCNVTLSFIIGTPSSMQSTKIDIRIYFAEFGEIFALVSNLLLIGGLLFFLAGLILVSGSRKEHAKKQRILKIAAVKKEVSISDLSCETELGPEYIREILTNLLISGFLFGYIE